QGDHALLDERGQFESAADFVDDRFFLQFVEHEGPPYLVGPWSVARGAPSNSCSMMAAAAATADSSSSLSTRCWYSPMRAISCLAPSRRRAITAGESVPRFSRRSRNTSSEVG